MQLKPLAQSASLAQTVAHAAPLQLKGEHGLLRSSGQPPRPSQVAAKI